MVKEEDVKAIAELLQSKGGSGDVESMLRTGFPDMRFTFCSTDDVAVRKPVMKIDNYEIYLYGGNHCLTLSNDYDNAAGVVIAEVEDE